MDGHAIDQLKGHGLKIAQPVQGYRFSLDPLALCGFAAVKAGARIADLGTGCGVIPLVLASRVDGVTVVAVEFQEAMAVLARYNVQLNALDEKISVVTEDILALKGRFPPSSFDVVVSNPPYRRPGTGRISRNAGRDKARHESTATLTDFMSIAKYLVIPGGKICFIYHVSRLAELFAQADALKLAPLRLRMIHDNAAAEAQMFMIELTKGRKGDMRVEPPLVIRERSGIMARK